MAHTYINPDGISKPAGYTHVVTAQGSRIVYISGQVARGKDGDVVGIGDLAKQTEQVYENLKTCLSLVGATFADVTKLTTFVVSYRPSVDLAIIGAARQKYLPADNPPASTLVGVQALAMPEFLVEIEATAVLS